MHTMDLGLVKYFLNIVICLCHEHDLLDTLNQRLQESTTGEFRYGGQGLLPIPELSNGMVSNLPQVQGDFLFMYFSILVFLLMWN